jgi:hypothetical protein
LQEGVDVGQTERPAVPDATSGVPENEFGEVGGTDKRAKGTEPTAGFVATGGGIGDHDVGLLSGITFGTIQKTKEEGAGVGREAATSSVTG